MNYQIIKLNNWSQIKELKNDWEWLSRASSYNTIFQMYEWNEAWWQAFGNSYELTGIVIKKQNEVVAIVPMTISSKNELELLGTPETEYQNILYDKKYPELMEIIINEILKLGKNRIIKLWEIPSAIPFAHYLKKILQEKKAYYLKTKTATFQSRLANRLNKKDVRYKTSKLSKIGKIDISLATSTYDEKIKLLELYFKWLETRFGKSISRYRKRQLSKEYESFCAYLIENFDGENNKPKVELESLSVDKQVIAISKIIQYKDVIYGIMQSYNPEYSNFSPGSILLQNSLNTWLEKGILVNDFLRGDEDYKMRYVNTSVELSRFTIYPSKMKMILSKIRLIFEQWLKPSVLAIYSFLIKAQQIQFGNLYKKIVFGILWISGLAWLYQSVTKHRCRILSYHSISDDPLRNKILSIRSNRFNQQVRYIKQQKSKGFTIDITFDDGYRDNYLIAYPILKKEEVKAVIFPTLNFIDNEIPGWHGEHAQRALTWNEIKEMRDSSIIEFGSHTVTHRDLGKLNIEEIRKELSESKILLDAVFLAYPFGKKENYNDQVIEIAKELGYKRAFTIEEGTNSKNVNPFAYKRMVVFDEPMYMFKVRVSGIIDDFLNIFS